MKPLLSPRELAEAIGVSESSLKRWADEGRIRASRTAGGHRRISLAEAVRFVRETGAALVRPDVLGMPDLQTVAGQRPARGMEGERLLTYLREGRAPEARGLILSLYLSGLPVAALCDGPIRHALWELGELWQHDGEGIFLEHRATDICIQALHQLRLTFPGVEDAPVAVGGAPEGDPYTIPSLMAATVLTSEGMHAVNLGPQSPADTLVRAARRYRAQLVWLSVSSVRNRAQLQRAVEELADRLQTQNCRLIVGGQARGSLGGDLGRHVQVGDSMAELAGFAKGVLAAAGHGGSAPPATGS